MTRDDIIRIALEAGFMLSTAYGQDSEKLMPTSDSQTLENFANLVAAVEREECARVCQSLDYIDGFGTAAEFAEAIRARGNPK